MRIQAALRCCVRSVDISWHADIGGIGVGRKDSAPAIVYSNWRSLGLYLETLQGRAS